MNEHAEKDYRAMQRITYSGLKHLARSPAHYYQWFHEPEDTPSKAQLIGNLVHTLVLEPNKYKKRYCIGLDVDRKSKANQAAWAAFEAENEGKKIITLDMLQQAEIMRDKVLSYPAASKVLAMGEAEKIVTWNDPDTGAECKMRCDFVNTQFGLLADLKTCGDAQPEKFAKDVYNYDYYIQAAFYLDGYNTAHGTNYTDFVLIAIEKEPPYGLICHSLDQDAINLGRMVYKPLLEKYAACMQSGLWHGYDQKLQVLSLPRWAFK